MELSGLTVWVLLWCVCTHRRPALMVVGWMLACMTVLAMAGLWSVFGLQGLMLFGLMKLECRAALKRREMRVKNGHD